MTLRRTRLRLACLRLACLTGLVCAAPLFLASGAMAGPAQSYQFQQRGAARACPPPLKFAAGACVRQCPAGYRDAGRTCRFKSMRH
ncbi:hypothetical protein ACLBWX_12960 [Methylobacterium sp. M6A4_1b]